jgi:putative MFS transporter
MGVFWSVGTALSALVGWAILPSIGWRFFFIASAFPSLLLVSLWKHLPESPRYLVLHGRLPEAIALFQTIAAKNNYPLAPNITILAPQEVGGGVTSGSVVKILGSIRITNWRPRVADWPMLSKTLKLFVIWSINVWGYYGLTFITPKIARSVTGDESSVYLSILLVTLAELPGLFLVTSLMLLEFFASVSCSNVCALAASSRYLSSSRYLYTSAGYASRRSAWPLQAAAAFVLLHWCFNHMFDGQLICRG